MKISPYDPIIPVRILVCPQKIFATIVSVIKAARSWLGRTNQLLIIIIIVVITGANKVHIQQDPTLSHLPSRCCVLKILECPSPGGRLRLSVWKEAAALFISSSPILR